jgi:predicted O-methyltransferase YrrM
MRKHFSGYSEAAAIASKFFFPKRNFQSPKGFTISYLFYRIIRPIFKSNYKIFKILNNGTPWTSQASIAIFKKILNKKMVGLEYGSGKSTLFFAARLKKLVSIEHNKEWYDFVNNLLKAKNVINVEYVYAPKNLKLKDATLLFHDSHDIKDSNFRIRSDYENYFEVVNKYPDNYFDFILIDGRARVECTFNSIAKLKQGGIMVLDNSERKRYQPVHKRLADWPKITTTTGLTDTTLWFKP